MNDGEVVPVTSWSKGDLQLWASGWGIEREVTELNHVHRQLKSVLTVMEGKEIHNVQLARSLREAHGMASHGEDLWSGLEYYYYRFQEGGGSEDGRRVDGSQGLLGLVEEEGGSRTAVVDDMPQVAEDTTEHSSSAALQIVPYVNVSSSMAPSASNNRPEWCFGISHEINEHVKACCKMTSNLREALELEHLDDRYIIVQSTGATDPRETSSCPTTPKVFGRDQDRRLVISKLTSEESAVKNLSVLAIVGYGGIGKTTLANVVFNDSAVSNHFDIRIWVYVSVYFDQAKIMHKMLESLTGDEHEHIKGLQELQGTLESSLKSTRVLLVLDDMWEDSQKGKWDELLTPLLSSDVLGNKILVTTRKPSVAKLIEAADQINLNGINEGDFWNFFKECAFGNEEYNVGRKLEEIGKSILVQLKGNPLAAKSVGKLLRKNHTVDFWERILNDSEWKQQSDDYDIMPALMISYKYLPVHLQPCFSYCAVFPKYYKYEKECLVNMWIAQGLICSTDNMHKRMEDIGSNFFSDLVEWGFLQKEFELMTTHIMHDLIHDLAQKVSSHETFTIGDTESRKAPQLVRHVSIIAEWVYKTEIDGTVHPNETFLRGFLKSFGELQVQQTSNLSTLLLFGPHDFEFAHSFRQEFTKVKSVRVLKLDMVLSDLDLMIGNIPSFINLRYLELGCFYKGPRLELPEAICMLYHLEVLDIKKNWGINTVLPRDMNKLVKLRHFIATDELHAKIAGVGDMVSLQELKAFGVRKASEFSIIQLRRLNQLRGTISICNLNDVGSQEEAFNASICDKVHLTGLHLSWNSVSEDRVHTKSKVAILEDLKPHAGLIDLGIIACRHPVPSWLSNNIHLTSLRSLHLDSCSYWKTVPTPQQLPLLRELRLINMFNVSNIEIGCLEILELRNLRCLTKCIVRDMKQFSVNLRVLEVEDCINLKEFPLLFISEDIPISECQFTHLHRLRVRGCFGHISISQLMHIDSLLYIDLFLRPNVEEFLLEPIGLSHGLRMEIKGTRKIVCKEEKFFPFNKLGDLEELEIRDYPNLKYLAWEGVQKLASLKTFKMSICHKLFSCMSIWGLSLPPSVQELEFSWCNITPKQLSQVLLSLPLLKKFSLLSCEEVTSLPIGLFTDEHNPMAEGSWHITPNFLTTLESLQFSFRMRAHLEETSVMHFWSKQCLGKFTSLKKVVIEDCPTLVLSTVISGGMSHIPPSSLVILKVCGITDCRLQFLEHSSLTELHIGGCASLTCVNLDGCTALRELHISRCDMLSSLDVMQSCEELQQLSIHGCKALHSLRVSLSNLTTLSIERNPNLAYLDLNSCTSLQKLCIKGCATTASWDGLKSLGALEDLKFEHSPGFTRSWQLASAEVESKHNNYFPRRLRVLNIDDIGVLCVPICNQLTSLKTLILHGSIFSRHDYVDVLTNNHERALLLVTSLRELEFDQFKHLRSLPAGLECLTTLQRLAVSKCELITSLPVGGIPASLMDMEVHGCSKELTALCREICRAQKIYFSIGKRETY